MKKLLVGVNLVLFSMIAVPARGDAPLDTIKSRINQVLDVLRDSSLQGESGKEVKKKKIQAILDNTFDYSELSKSTLSRNWERLTPDQRQEFQQLYKALLEKVYMDTILGYKDQQVVFGKNRELGENKFEIQTKLVTESKEIPINFRVISKSGEWRVYDVVIENISLVTNYRSQFNRVLTKESPAEMLASLRKKVNGQ